jgi:AraC-like DNA-binding protein
MPTFVRAACLTHFAEVARAVGLDPIRQLLDAGLEPMVLREPDLLISNSLVRKLLEACAAQSGQPAFGLRMAQSRHLSNLGPVGMLVRDQPTPRASIQVLIRYLSIMNGALAMQIEDQGSLVVVREELMALPKEPVRQSIELAIGVLVMTMRQIFSASWRPVEVSFTHAAPAKTPFHDEFFQTSVRFNGAFNGISCLKTEMDAINSQADPTMARYAQRLLENTPLARSLDEDGLVVNIRRTIMLLLPAGRCTIELASSHLGLTSRTVQRRLSDEGKTFSSLMNEIRIDLAERYIEQGTRPITDVAALLGFSELSAFSRWYQQHFGQSPSHSRSLRDSVASASVDANH